MASETFRNALSLKDYGFSADTALGLLHLKSLVPGRRDVRLTCGPASFEGWVSIFTTFAKAAVQRPPPVAKCGWLERKGKRRWIVLSDDELYWFRSELQSKPETTDLRRHCSGHIGLLYATVHTTSSQLHIASAQGDRAVVLAGKAADLAEWANAVAEAEERVRVAHEKWVREHPALFHIEHRGYLVKNERPLFFVVQMGRLSWFMTDKRTLLSDDEVPSSKYTNKEKFSTPLPPTTNEAVKAVLSNLVQPSDYIRPEPPSDSSSPLTEAALPFKLEDPHLFVPYYKLYFVDRPHYNFVGKDADGSPIIVSLQKRRSPGKRVKALIRTRRENERRELPLGRDKLAGLLAELGDAAATWQLQRCSMPELEAALVQWEDRLIVRTYKFGVIYQKAGQTDEDSLYNNRETSAAYEEFLAWLGTRVKLQGWDKFRGGLNVRDNSTGEHSVYSTVGSTEVMFHVATLIPHHANDQQQVERKRHLGNDVCMLVFRDADAQTPFDLTIFKSQFNHVFALLQPDPSAPGKYRMGFSHKLGVADHGPFLPAQASYDRTEVLRQFLLAKLINGERGAMYAPDFKGKMISTRKQTLLDLIATYPPDPAPVSNTSGTGEGSLESTKKMALQSLDVAAGTAQNMANLAKGKLGKLFKSTSTNNAAASGNNSSASGNPGTSNANPNSNPNSSTLSLQGSSSSITTAPPPPASVALAPPVITTTPSSPPTSHHSTRVQVLPTSPPPVAATSTSTGSSSGTLTGSSGPGSGIYKTPPPSPTPEPVSAATSSHASSASSTSGHRRTPSVSKPLPKAPARKPTEPSPATPTDSQGSGAGSDSSDSNNSAGNAPTSVAGRAGWKPYVNSKSMRSSSEASVVPSASTPTPTGVGGKRMLWVGGSRADMEAVARQIKDPVIQLTPLPNSTALRDWLAASGELYGCASVRVVTNRYRADDGGDLAAEQLVGFLRADPKWRDLEILVLCGEPAKVLHLRSPYTRVTSDLSEALRFASFAPLPPLDAAPAVLSASIPVVPPSHAHDEHHKVPNKPLPKAGSKIESHPPSGFGANSLASSSTSVTSNLSAPSSAYSSPTSISTSSSLSSSASAPTSAPPSAPAKKPRRVKALWAFQGAQPGDLSFGAGDVITIVGEVEQWLEGQLNGVTGIFPSVRLFLQCYR